MPVYCWPMMTSLLTFIFESNLRMRNENDFSFLFFFRLVISKVKEMMIIYDGNLRIVSYNNLMKRLVDKGITNECLFNEN